MKIAAHFADYTHRIERKKLNTFGALGYYRIYSPMQEIKKAHEVDIIGTEIDSFGDSFEANWQNIFRKYDCFWMLHAFGEQSLSAQAYFAHQYNKLLIYDLDDNYLDVPESNPVYEQFKKAESIQDVNSVRTRGALSAAFSLADALVVSTDPLKERMEQHFKDVYGLDKRVYVIPNMNRLADWDFVPPKKHTDKVVIGYSGSNSHQEDLLLAFPAIRRLMQKYPHVYLEIIGAIDKKKLDYYFGSWEPALLERVGMLPATPTFWEYPEHLSKQQWDIGIAPLVDSPFTRCKSHIKWMEYAMFKIPTVASRVYPYFMDIQGKQTIVDGETGFLCKPNDWESKLEKLILHKGLRESIGQNAYDAVKDTWQYADGKILETVDTMFREIAK